MRETHAVYTAAPARAREHKCKLALSQRVAYKHVRARVCTRARTQKRSRNFAPEMHWVTKVYVHPRKLEESVRTDVRSCIFEKYPCFTRNKKSNFSEKNALNEEIYEIKVAKYR